MDSDSIDLIATDPPFNTKRQFNAPLGTKAVKQRFDDRWRWDDVTDEWQILLATRPPAIKEIIEAAVVIEGGKIYHEKKGTRINTGRVKNSIAAFLVWMAPRLLEMKRILKPTGSIYLHCDPAANSYLRLLMDAVFGRSNFRNEIVWSYKKVSNSRAKKFLRAHDTILFYSGGSREYYYNPTYDSDPSPRKKQLIRAGYNTKNMDGQRYLYIYDDAVVKQKEAQGKIDRNRFDIIRFVDTTKGNRHTDVFEIDFLNPRSKEYTGWKTQKPWELYQRIIRASSKEGDLVLDPFCGCATTCVAAEREGRRWIGIDVDPVAETVTKKQLFDTAAMDQMLDDAFVKVKKSPPKKGLSIPEMRLLLWKRNGGICGNPYCMHELRIEDTHLDHIIPKKRGGADDITNRNILCGNCNSRKSGKSWNAFLNAEQAKQPHRVVGSHGQ